MLGDKTVLDLTPLGEIDLTHQSGLGILLHIDN